MIDHGEIRIKPKRIAVKTITGIIFFALLPYNLVALMSLFEV